MAQDELIDSPELARRLGLNVGTPGVWRAKGKGPPYRKLPGVSTVLYSWNDVLAWSKRGTVKPENDGLRGMRMRAKGGDVEAIEYDNAAHQVDIPAAEVREHVQRGRGAR